MVHLATVAADDFTSILHFLIEQQFYRLYKCASGDNFCKSGTPSINTLTHKISSLFLSSSINAGLVVKDWQWRMVTYTTDHRHELIDWVDPIMESRKKKTKEMKLTLSDCYFSFFSFIFLLFIRNCYQFLWFLEQMYRHALVFVIIVKKAKKLKKIFFFFLIIKKKKKNW